MPRSFVYGHICFMYRPDLCGIAATPGILAEMFNVRPDFTIIAAEKASNLLCSGLDPPGSVVVCTPMIDSVLPHPSLLSLSFFLRGLSSRESLPFSAIGHLGLWRSTREA